MKCRLAIRAANFGPEADISCEQWRQNLNTREKTRKLCASSFLFNDLEFLVIPRKSLRFLTLLFSIPTAPTKSHN